MFNVKTAVFLNKIVRFVMEIEGLAQVLSIFLNAPAEMELLMIIFQ